MLKEKLGGLQTFLGNNVFKHVPFSPNQISILSLLLSVVAAFFIIQQNVFLGALLFLIAGFFDAIDGAVARAKNQVTKFGGYLDGVIDRFVEAIFLFSLMFYPFPIVFVSHQIWLAILIFIGTCMPSFVRAYAEHKQILTHEQATKLGGFARTERVLLIVISLGLSYFDLHFFVYGVILSIILSFITVAYRIYRVYKN